MAVKKKKHGSGKPKNRDLKVSRRAAGVNVAISIAAAAALLVIANFISHKKHYRRDMETLGRYGLSDTAEKILDQTDQPIRLTSIYTSTKPDRKPQEYLRRLRDLLSEIGRRGDNVTVVNVTSDRGKAEVMGRLRARLDESAAEHRKVITDFQILAREQGSLYEQMSLEWRRYPSKGWLTQFAIPKVVETAMAAGKEELQKTAMNIRQELATASLPDYPNMVGEVTGTLRDIHVSLEQISGHLRKLSSLPEEASKVRPELTKSAGEVVATIGDASRRIGKGGSPVPSNPSGMLKTFAADARMIADAAELAATRLDRFAADGYARYARSWRTGRTPLPSRYRRLAEDVNYITDEAEALLRLAAKAESQKQLIERARRMMPRFAADAGNIQAAVGRFMDELTKVDEPTKKIFARAGRDRHLQAQIKPLAKLLEQAGKVGTLDDWRELIEQINQDNIVLVEIGEKSGVVGFDEVWPLAAGRQADTDDEQEQPKRVFHGDMAICTKILSLATEPFAEVVLTYFEHIPAGRSAYLRQQPVVGPIYSGYLRTVRERLEKANLEVSEWNLFKIKRPGEDKKDAQGTLPPPKKPGRPQVLLVLPPPEASPMPPMVRQQPQWNPDEVEKVRKVVAGGTPAVFLAGYFRPRYLGEVALPAHYGFGEYLRNDWGIDVMVSLRVLQARPDPVNPGSFKRPFVRWWFMPLSSFTDHPIGRPLKARRVYWLNACPVVRVKDSRAGAVIEDILAVPEERRDMWATTQAERMLRDMGKSSGIRPDTESGDRLPPFAVAVKADKDINGKEAQIVVLGVGASYGDDFLNTRIPKLTGEDTLGSEPPPTAGMDLLVNSIYHLIGKDEYIGAGPAVVEPVKIAPRTMSLVKILFGLAWPALMFAAGLVVMLLRRR